jgi:hypothetical protein
MDPLDGPFFDRREQRWLLSRLVAFDVNSPRLGTMRLSPSILNGAPIV